MSLRAAARPGLALALLAVCACGSGGEVPGREPEVRGVVSTDFGGTPVLTQSSDGYYEGMSLDRGAPTVVGASDGPVDELEAGDSVEVWVSGPCAESYPVQCEIEAVRLLG